jgi:ABC-type oligopeptide transport system ATPase subunit
VEFGETEALIAHPKQAYTQQLFTAAEMTWRAIAAQSCLKNRQFTSSLSLNIQYKHRLKLNKPGW